MARLVISLLLLVLVSLWATFAQAVEKLKFGISTANAQYLLPPTFALEKGFWKERGLEVEVIPFRGGGPAYRAMAAGEIKMGTVSASSFIPAVAARVSAIMVAQMMAEPDFLIWVKGDSPIKEPRDLRGAKVGVTRLGSASHVFATVAVRHLGIEKDVKIVASGGAPEMIAALKAGIVQAIVSAIYTQVELEARGEVRQVLDLKDYLPRPWVEVISVADPAFAREKRDATRKLLAGLLEGTEYVQANNRPVVAKMMATYGYSEEVAQRVYSFLKYTRGGKIDPQALANVREFLLTYDLVRKDRAPALGDLYTRAFTE